MCEVTTLLAVASIGASAMGAVQQASAQRAQGRFQQQLAERQAEERDRAARERITAAREDEVARRLETGRLRAEQIAQFGAAGVDTASGSPLRTVEDTSFFGEIDALRIRTRGANEAESLFRQGEIDRVSGRNARAAGNRSATQSLLGGASTVGRQFFSFRQAGVL